MATLTTSIGNVELTIDELRELLTANSVKVAETNYKVAEKVAEIVEKVEIVKSEHSEMVSVIAKCGHSVMRKSARGRKPNSCADCSGDRKSEASESPKPVEKPQNGSRKPTGGFKRGSKREFDAEKFEAWMAEHGDEEMREGWERKIRWMITDGYKMSQSQRSKYLARLDSDPRLTNNQARNLREEILHSHKRVA